MHCGLNSHSSQVWEWLTTPLPLSIRPHQSVSPPTMSSRLLYLSLNLSWHRLTWIESGSVELWPWQPASRSVAGLGWATLSPVSCLGPRSVRLLLSPPPPPRQARRCSPGDAPAGAVWFLQRTPATWRKTGTVIISYGEREATCLQLVSYAFFLLL